MSLAKLLAARRKLSQASAGLVGACIKDLHNLEQSERKKSVRVIGHKAADAMRKQDIHTAKREQVLEQAKIVFPFHNL